MSASNPQGESSPTPDPVVQPLPPRANLEHLRKQAKDLTKAQPGLSLSDALHSVAKQYGFASWPKLKAELEARDAGAFHATARDDDSGVIRRLAKAHPEFVRRHVSHLDEHEAIHYAARGGHVEAVRVLLEAGADPLKGIYPNRGETTARHLAEAWGHAEVVAVIDQHLSRTRNTSPAGSAFMRLIEAGDVAGVAAALDHDASLLNSADNTGDTPLHRAAARGKLEITRLLLDRGADVDARNPAGYRPIHRTLYQKQKGYVASPHPEVARLLIERGAVVDVWVASAMGDVDVIERLLRDDPTAAGKPIDILPWSAGIYPATAIFPLTMAALHGHDRICQILLDTGADPDARKAAAYKEDEVDMLELCLPLTFAATRNLLSTARLLLDRGANANTKIMAGGSAIEAALAGGHTEMVALLMGRGAKANAYALVEAGYHDEAMRRAAEDPHQADHVVWAGLLAGKPELVRAALPLMLAGAVDPQRWPNLMWQVMRPAAEDEAHLARLVEGYNLLLDAVPEVNACKHEGGNTLHRLADDFARRLPPNQRLAYGRLLIDHGVDLNVIEADFQSTPLGFAARNGYAELVELFLARGADVMLAGKPWATPLAWARKMGHGEIVRILLEKGAAR